MNYANILAANSRRILRYVRAPLLGTVALTSIDAGALLAILGNVSRTTLILVLLLEGGLGLLVGALVALSSTPSVAKFGEMSFGTAPWSREGERNAERVGWKLMFTASLLIAIGFSVSML